jgi:hypothetical protein
MIKAMVVSLFFIALSQASTAQRAEPMAKAFGIQSKTIAANVIAAVKATPTTNAFGITGYQRITQQIVKAEAITINSKALAVFDRTDVPFVAIVAKDLYIEVPATNEDAARLTRAPDNLFLSLAGADGSAGADGTSPGGESGTFGGDAQPGGNGGDAGTSVIPDIYIFFNRIITSAGNPSAAGLLKIVTNGVPGWNGGNGGRGGNGGSGSTGTPASCGILTCNAGPGIGGNGGRGGTGGKGGNAGAGGRGGNVYLVGPASQFNTAAFFQIYQEGAAEGQPGRAGGAGNGGSPGGGGRMCTYCNGRDPGDWGPAASPRDLGPGAPSARGNRGDRGLFDRNNSDLF